MSIPVDCFDYIIGLSRSSCNCYSDRPVDFDASLSGLYMDEFSPLDQLKGLENCENGSVWDKMANARENAIRFFISDMNSKLQKKYLLKRKPYKGTIGNKTFTEDRILVNSYNGIRVFCSDIISGYMKIKKINTIFNSTGAFNLFIYNNMNELITTVSLNTVADLYTQNTVNIELPLHSDFVNNLEYYFVYSGITPKNNTLECACGKHSHFNKTESQRFKWADFIQVSGFDTDSLDFIELSHSHSIYLNGLILEVELYCKLNDLFCSEWDFDTDPINASVAYAIAFKATEICLKSIISSTDLSRETMVNAETIEKFMMDYSQKYEDKTADILEEVDITKNDCLMCRDELGMKITGILS